MQIYADVPARRARQVGADAVAAVVIVLSVRAGVAVHRLIGQLAEPGRAAQEAGLSIARSAGRGRAAVADVPLLRAVLRQPLDALREAGVSLAEAGQAQQTVISDLSWWLAVLVAALPIVVLLAYHLPRRVRWVRDAAAAGRLAAMPDGTRVLAARALATLPLPQVARAGTDPHALAAAALAELGLEPRSPPGPDARPASGPPQ